MRPLLRVLAALAILLLCAGLGAPQRKDWQAPTRGSR